MPRIVIPPLAGETPDAFFRRQESELRLPGALTRRLDWIDSSMRPFRRIYLMGCGRSGTWLLTAMFATFGNLEILAKERPFEDFGFAATEKDVLLIKRDSSAYQRVADIDPRIEVAYIVRHPFAVLTSHNPASNRAGYHISPHRWLGEMQSLQYLVDTARQRTTIVRYEDMVIDAEHVQAHLARCFGLPVRRPVDDMPNIFTGPPEAVAAMHGLRPIDRNSLDRFRDDPEKITYLRDLRPRLGRLLDWVGETYAYDVTL